jgi:apolipoprotein D and lipocalin family protein
MNTREHLPMRHRSDIERFHGDTSLSLDELILNAEKAVIARDERVQRQAREVLHRVHPQGTRRIGMGLAVGAGVLALIWLLPRVRSRSSSAPRPVPVAAKKTFLSGWTRAASLAWSLSRLMGRPSLGSALTTLLMTVGLPAAVKAGTSARQPDLVPMPNVDLSRYVGQWFEVASLNNGGHDSSARASSVTYAFGRDGIHVMRRHRHPDGSEERAFGVARAVPGSHGTKMKVSIAPSWLRWLPWVWDELWVLQLDANYRTALVGTPDHRKLWVLSRTPQLDELELQRMAGAAHMQGYDTSALRRTSLTAY